MGKIATSTTFDDETMKRLERAKMVTGLSKSDLVRECLRRSAGETIKRLLERGDHAEEIGTVRQTNVLLERDNVEMIGKAIETVERRTGRRPTQAQVIRISIAIGLEQVMTAKAEEIINAARADR